MKGGFGPRLTAIALTAGMSGGVLGCGPAVDPELESLPGGWPWASAEAARSLEAGTGPVASTLLVPGGRAAVCWLPDGSFWTGDVGIRLLWQDGTPIDFTAREFVETGVPIYRSTALRDSVRVHALALVPWRGGSYDSVVVCQLALRLEAMGSQDRDVTLLAEVTAGGGTHHSLHPRAALQDSFVYRVRGRDLERNGDLVCRLGPPWTGALGAWKSTAPLSHDRWLRFAAAGCRLTPGRPVVWRLWVPGRPRLLPPWTQAGTATGSVARTLRSWRALLARGSRFEVPDQDVQRVFDASRAVAIACFETRADGVPQAIGNPMQYRDFYLRDGARHMRALDLLGFPALAGAVLDQMFQFQWPPGAFISQRAQLDGTGQALWALDQHLALARDTLRAVEKLSQAWAGARWVERMRRYSHLRGGPAAGLLPYSDPRDNELLQGHLLGSDAWAVAGLSAVAGVSESLGRGEEALHWSQEAEEYRAHLVRVWRVEAARQGRPLPPAVERGARDWGNVSAVYPLAVLEPDDAHFTDFANWYRRHDFRNGLPSLGTIDSVHHYLGFDLTQATLRAGDREQVLQDLHATIAYTQADGTGFEFFHAEDRGFGKNLPPHVTFASMFVDLVRCMLLYERGDSLVLLAGVPASWLADGRVLAVEGAPTRFGPASFRVEGGPEGTVSMRADLPAAAVLAWPEPVERLPSPVASRPERHSVLPPGKTESAWRLGQEE